MKRGRGQRGAERVAREVERDRELAKLDRELMELEFLIPELEVKPSGLGNIEEVKEVAPRVRRGVQRWWIERDS